MTAVVIGIVVAGVGVILAIALSDVVLGSFDQEQAKLAEEAVEETVEDTSVLEPGPSCVGHPDGADVDCGPCQDARFELAHWRRAVQAIDAEQRRPK